MAPSRPSSRPGWSTVTVAGHACEAYLPDAPKNGRGLIALHGLHETRFQDDPLLASCIEAAALPVLAPRTGRSWWLDRIMPGFDPRQTPERHVVGAVRAEMAARFGIEPPGIGLFGVGMGGQGALRIAYRHPQLFPVAAAIAPAIDFHAGMRAAGDRDDGELFDTLWESFGDVERARQETAILHVHPLNWPRHQCFASDPDDTDWHDGAARLHGKLAALGIPHTARFGPGGPAHARGVAEETFRFLLDALDAEARRLPA